jgi:uncharacterized protein (DUF1330 family)
MPAYCIFVCQEVTDREQLETYWAKIGATLAGFDMKPITAYAPLEILEGDHVEGVVVVEFPSMEIARNWYNSPAYVEARQHRIAGAKYTGMLVENCFPPPHERMVKK